MLLRHRIYLTVAGALLGVFLVAAFGLYTLHQTLYEGKREQIHKVALLAMGVLQRYQAQEASGALTRAEAQARAVEALTGLHLGDDYIFVRAGDDRMLVHADPSRVGKLDKGSPTTDGRLSSAVFREGLAREDRFYMVAYVARPGDPAKKPVAKLLGAVRFAPWDWVVGNGVYVDDLDDIFWSNVYRYLAIGGLGTALMVMLGWSLVRSVRVQLGGEPAYAAAVVNQIAAGDLSQAIRVDGPPASLLASMERMRASLRSIVADVNRGSRSIQLATDEVASGNLDLSNRTEQSAATVEQTSASIQELASHVQQTADAARQASQLAHEASVVASQGGTVVGQVVSTMGAISASSKKINDIISVIDGIAFQTNILALNAAVEAARAGEQGRGFAVVASEVRTLSQRSAQAASEIKSLISSSVTSVESGSVLVQQAGARMEDIVGAVAKLVAMIGDISVSAELQSSGIQEIVKAVAQMDQMTQQNAALVEQGAAASSSLNDQALALNAVVGVFHLDGAAVPAISASRP